MLPPVLFIIIYCKCNLAFKTLGVLNSLRWPPGSSSSCCLILVILVLKQQICRLSEGSWGLSGGYKHNPVALLLNFVDDERHKLGHPVPAGCLVLQGRPTISCFDLALVTVSVCRHHSPKQIILCTVVYPQQMSCLQRVQLWMRPREEVLSKVQRDTWPDFPLMVDMLYLIIMSVWTNL